MGLRNNPRVTDIWDHIPGAAEPRKVECCRVDSEPTKAEIVELLQRRVDRVAREATAARRARAKQKEV